MTTNSIAISQNLVDAGLELKAANAIAVAMDSNVNENLATKTDLAKMEAATKSDLVKVETGIRADLVKMEAATKSDLGKMDTKIEVLSTKVDALTSSVKGQTNMIYGLYVGLAVLVVNAVTGA